LPTVSLAGRGDQAAGLGLRADPAGLAADVSIICVPAGVLNGGVLARIPISRGQDGVAVAESDPRFPGKRPFSPFKKNSVRFCRRATPIPIQGLRALLQTAWIQFERLLSALDRLVAALVALMAPWSLAIGG